MEILGLIGFALVAMLVIRFLGAFLYTVVKLTYCPKAPEHFWQNTGVVDKYNRHVYLCLYCNWTHHRLTGPTNQSAHPIELR